MTKMNKKVTITEDITELTIPLGALISGSLVSSPIYPAESYPPRVNKVIIIPML
jgi:hypothetical protein